MDLANIYNRFVYDTQPEFETMEKDWVRLLGIKIHPDEKCNFIEVPPLEEIIKKLYEHDEIIKTDCRFFAMFMANLIKNKLSNKLSKSLFTMPKTSIPEIMVPDNCHYISLDTDIFVLDNDKDKDPIYLSKALDSDQGQWIVKIEDDLYMGIVDEGVVFLKMDEFVKRFEKNVNKHINTKKNNNAYKGLLRCYIGKYGLKTGAYNFSNYGTPKNILVN